MTADSAAINRFFALETREVGAERQARKYLHRQGASTISRKIIDAVNKAREINTLEKSILEIVAEKLSKISPFKLVTGKAEVEAENDVLDFLDSF